MRPALIAPLDAAASYPFAHDPVTPSCTQRPLLPSHLVMRLQPPASNRSWHCLRRSGVVESRLDPHPVNLDSLPGQLRANYPGYTSDATPLQ